MHELSVAESLKDEIKHIAETQGIKKIISVTLVIGELSGIDKEALSFALPFVCENTFLEGVKFIYEEEPVEIICNDCGRLSKSEVPFFICEYCKSGNVGIIKGKNLLIKNMEVE